MKRYAICPVIGSGSESDPYRAKVPAGMSQVAVIPPGSLWALVEVAGSDLSALDADAEVDAFPSVSEDLKLSTLPRAVQNAMKGVLQRRGVGMTFGADDTVGDVIDAIGTYLDGKPVVGHINVRDEA